MTDQKPDAINQGVAVIAEQLARTKAFTAPQVIGIIKYLNKHGYFGNHSQEALILLDYLRVLNLLFCGGLNARQIIIAAIFFPFNFLKETAPLDFGVLALHHAHQAVIELDPVEQAMLRWSGWGEKESPQLKEVFLIQSAVHLLRGGCRINYEFAEMLMAAVRLHNDEKQKAAVAAAVDEQKNKEEKTDEKR